jgi:hypothetical protein
VVASLILKVWVRVRVRVRARARLKVSLNREVVEDVTELSVTIAATSGGEQ